MQLIHPTAWLREEISLNGNDDALFSLSIKGSARDDVVESFEDHDVCFVSKALSSSAGESRAVWFT